MKKHVFAGAVIALMLSLRLSAAVAAGPAEAPDKSQARAARFSAEDFAAFSEIRIAALKSGLQLTAAQNKKWPALETALRDEARSHAARAAEAHEKAGMSPDDHNVIERLRDRGKKLEAEAAELAAIADEFKTLADAAGPLYDSLDDAQKRKFEPLLRKHVGLPDRRYIEPQKDAQTPQ